MKLRLVFFLLMMMSYASFAQSNNVGYDFTVGQGKFSDWGKYGYLIVPLTFTNNTNQTLQYYSYSCSWWDCYKLDCKDLIWNPSYPCPTNAPVLLTLAPHQKFETKLELKITHKVKSFKYKIGFNLITDKAKLNLAQLKAHKPNILWSNVIQMTI